MVTLTGAWTEDELGTFLDETAIPIRIACRTPAGGLWMLSLWYRYDGAFHCATSASADVVDYLESDPGVAFEVSTNDPPYMGVRGAGEASLSIMDDRDLLRDLLERYLGGTDSGLARKLLDPDREEVRIDIEPRKLYTWDFSNRMADAVGSESRPSGGRANDDPP